MSRSPTRSGLKTRAPWVLVPGWILVICEAWLVFVFLAPVVLIFLSVKDTMMTPFSHWIHSVFLQQKLCRSLLSERCRAIRWLVWVSVWTLMWDERFKLFWLSEGRSVCSNLQVTYGWQEWKRITAVAAALCVTRVTHSHTDDNSLCWSCRTTHTHQTKVWESEILPFSVGV